MSTEDTQDVDLNTYEQESEDTAEEVETTSEEATRLQNLQREFDRKLQNSSEMTQKQLQQLADSQARLMEMFNSSSTSQEDTDEDLENLMYSDPKAYASKIKEMTKREVMSEVEKSSQAQSQKTAALQGAINEVISQYPELAKTDNPLTKRVYEIVGSDPAQIDPRDLKLAVYQASNELNIAPISKRNKTMKDDDFAGLSSKGQKSKAPRTKESKIPEGTTAWAKALGLNLKDPVTKKRLEARSKREWMKFKAVDRDLTEEFGDE